MAKKETPAQKAARLARERIAEAQSQERLAKARRDAAKDTVRATEAEQEYNSAIESRLLSEMELADLLGKTDEVENYANWLEVLRRNQDELAEAIKAAAEAQKSLEAAMSAGSSAAKNLAGSIGLVNKGYSKFSMDAEGAEKALEGFTKELGETLSASNLAANLFGTVWDETIKQLTSIDNATTDLKKTFGVTFGTELAGNLTAIQGDMRILGFSASDTEQSMVALASGISDFKNMSDDAQKSLTANATLLTRFGISAADSAEGIEYMTEVLGQTPDDAEENLRRFVDLGDQIGKQPGIIASEFASMQGTFARYGDEAVKTFMKTQIAAKRLGFETSELIAISEGFDTFETAGESVGTLNALLGGPFLNSIEMIQETDPVERLEMIREALFMSGRSFADMAERERMALAEHIPGINGDVALLGRIMSDMNQDIALNAEDMAALTGETASGFDELTGKAKKAMTIGEMFEAIKSGFALPPETIDGIITLIKTILGLVGGLGNAITEVMGFFVKLSAKGGLVAKFFKGIWGKLFGPGGKKVLAEGAEKVGETIGKKVGGTFAEWMGKTALKKIPFIGLFVGLGLALDRLAKKDYFGALAEAVSGLASMVPLFGTIVSIIIDIILLIKDLGYMSERFFSVFSGVMGGGVAGGVAGAGIFTPITAPVGAIAGGVAAYQATAPGLANGGVVPATPRPYILGDGGQREVVQPLDEFKKSNAGASNIHVTVGFDYDGRGLKAFVKDTIYSDMIT